jgi:SAM-dependent methyltransferase
MLKKSIPNLAGDRDVEWSWIAANMPDGPGDALDFGAGSGFLSFIAAQRQFKVTAVDLGKAQWYFVHPGLQFIQRDILELSLPENHFDLVINCSTVEHAGLAGRYGVTRDNPDGDLDAMTSLYAIMKSDGIMLLTIPVGQDAVFAPLTRVYGVQRLPKLLKNFTVETEAFWEKDTQNRWVITDKNSALGFKATAGSWNPLRNKYALGCFILKKQ